MLAIVTGFIAGLTHVLSGPDHWGALCPLAVERRGAAWLLGLRWGLGHTAGVLAVGAAALASKSSLHLEPVSAFSERLVGIALIAVGIWGLKLALSRKLHAHPHRHAGQDHLHVHWHAGHTAHRTEGHAARGMNHHHKHAAFGIGVLHGVAGSAHLLGVLPALAFERLGESLSYMAAFGVGTILSMSAAAAAIGLCAQGLFMRAARLQQALMLVCSFSAMGVGVWWLGM